MSTPLKDMIRQVNGRVNRRLVEDTHVELYELEDFWTRALAQRDTADHAIAKAILLLDEGFPEENLRVAMVIDQRGAYRAVLFARVEDGEWVLDNQHFFIVRPQELGDLVEKIQVPCKNEWSLPR